MRLILFNKNSREIIEDKPDVVFYTNDSVSGCNWTMRGIPVTIGFASDELLSVDLRAIASIDEQLAALDVIIPRSSEDLYATANITPYVTVQEAIVQKQILRAQRVEALGQG